jgi:hypothetical protein
VLKAGILKDLRRKRHYVKPSEARQLKMAAARRRGGGGRARAGGGGGGGWASVPRSRSRR